MSCRIPWLFFLLFAGFVQGACPEAFQRLVDAPSPTSLQELTRRVRRLKIQDKGSEVGRYPKQITRNSRRHPEGPRLIAELDETADLARPLKVHLPDGRVEERIYGSGRYALRPRSAGMDGLLRGGLIGRDRVRITYVFPNGQPMGGTYHLGSLPWDSYLVPFPDGKGGFRYVGYLGAMVPPTSMRGAPVDAPANPTGQWHNFSRSRHAAEVVFDGNGNETWYDRGSIHGKLPHYASRMTGNGMDADWLGKQDPEKQGFRHGYGGRPFQNRDGTPLRWDGTYWMSYEVVTKVTTILNPYTGRPERLPSWTEVRAQRLHEDGLSLYVAGERLPDGRSCEEEITLVSPDSALAPGLPHRKQPYPQTDRGGHFMNLEGKWQDGGVWHLIEGFNPSWGTVVVGGEEIWLATASPGNYIEGGGTGKHYGGCLFYRKASEGPIGPWRPVVDAKGELYNFLLEFEERYGLAWVGRPDLFTHTTQRTVEGVTNEQQEWWAFAHGLDLSTVSADFPRGRFPTSEEFPRAFRNAYVLPITLSLKPHPLLKDETMPWVEVEDPPVKDFELRLP